MKPNGGLTASRPWASFLDGACKPPYDSIRSYRNIMNNAAQIDLAISLFAYPLRFYGKYFKGREVPEMIRGIPRIS